MSIRNYSQETVMSDREVMEKELIILGLRPTLLDKLSNSVIVQLFELIGWAAPAFYEDKQTGEQNDRAES